MEESTHKPTYQELEACLRKAERRARKAEASLEKSKDEKAALKAENQRVGKDPKSQKF